MRLPRLLTVTVLLGITSYGFAIYAQAPSAAKAPTAAGTPTAAGKFASAPTSTGLASPETAPIRKQMTTFQGILMREMQQSFEQPFGLLQDVKGIYLSRYGVAFHMELNLVPLRILTMFDYRPYTEEELRRTRDLKLARIEQLKTRLGDLLIAHGQELTAVPVDQQIAIVIHLFNMPSERVDGLPTQLVIEVSRKILVDAKSGAISREEFQKRAVVHTI